MKKLIGILTIAILSGFQVNTKRSIEVSGTVLNHKTNLPIAKVLVVVKGTDIGTTTDSKGKFSLAFQGESGTLIFNAKNYQEQRIKVVSDNKNLMVKMISTFSKELDADYAEEEITNEVILFESQVSGSRLTKSKKSMAMGQYATPFIADGFYQDHNTEEYDVITENVFHDPKSNPLSTFSIDVDGASYSNLRRMINSGQKPYIDMVRIEEMINYFNYDYPDATGKHPFSITTEVAQAPWNKQHKLVHIGLQGKKLDYENTDPANLVFLVDVSGSMSAQNKLPLLKSSLKMLVNQLSAKDRISIVAYAGAAGLVLPPTPASEKTKIISALDRLQSGGSTAGGQGIKLAYKVAEENLIRGGNNRVILATDGDFNVGVSSTSEMVRLIEEKRKTGIYLTITGFGMGNYKDGRMEQISNAGNGNYYYIDNINEARKVFITEMQATLFTIAKDVKIQVEFNPSKVQAYRLIGYENRKMNAEDFNDDKKDAGELGAGHSVTALYEIIPTGIESDFIASIDPLKYQSITKTMSNDSNDLLTVKFRYKNPNEERSQLITSVLVDKSTNINRSSEDFRFAAAVASFGMLLRDSEFKQSSSYEKVLTLALAAKGEDILGYRREFINMVRNTMEFDKEKL